MYIVILFLFSIVLKFKPAVRCSLWVASFSFRKWSKRETEYIYIFFIPELSHSSHCSILREVKRLCHLSWKEMSTIMTNKWNIRQGDVIDHVFNGCKAPKTDSYRSSFFSWSNCSRSVSDNLFCSDYLPDVASLKLLSQLFNREVRKLDLPWN